MFRTHLTIAGVGFEVSCEREIINDAPPHAYAEFYDSTANYDTVVNVELIPEPLRSIDTFERLFDVGDMWSLFQSSNTYYAVHTGFGLDNPMWAAEFQPKFSGVRIFCGNILLSDTGSVSNPLRYPLDQILLTLLLADRGGILVHSAGIEYDGKLWLLAGKSGAGKSTSSKLLMGRNGVALLSDDRIVLRRINGFYYGYGTPWPGEARMALNRAAPLGGILLLEKSKENSINEVTPTAAFEKMLPVVSVPWYQHRFFEPVMDFCGSLAQNIPMFTLNFRPDEDAAEMLQDFMAR